MQFAAASGRQWASIEQVFDPIKEKIFICRTMALTWAAMDVSCL